MANLFEPPTAYDLPLVKGQDLVVDFKNKVPGSDPAEYVAYAAGVAVRLEIDTTPPTIATATISTHHAVVRVESTVSDAIEKGLLWRCVISLPGTPTTERVPANGVTVRADGAKRSR